MIAAGFDNYTSETAVAASTVGGWGNVCEGQYSVILSGTYNSVTGESGAVLGGKDNVNDGDDAGILGGNGNSTSSAEAIVP